MTNVVGGRISLHRGTLMFAVNTTQILKLIPHDPSLLTLRLVLRSRLTLVYTGETHARGAWRVAYRPSDHSINIVKGGRGAARWPSRV